MLKEIVCTFYTKIINLTNLGAIKTKVFILLLEGDFEKNKIVKEELVHIKFFQLQMKLMQFKTIFYAQQ